MTAVISSFSIWLVIVVVVAIVLDVAVASIQRLQRQCVSVSFSRFELSNYTTLSLTLNFDFGKGRI